MMPHVHNLALVLSYRFPSSACSATVRSGSFWGMMRRGVVPGTTLYLEKSVTPACSRRKSSSRRSSPLTTEGGARRMARMASEKMAALRRSLASSGFLAVNCRVAADSMA